MTDFDDLLYGDTDEPLPEEPEVPESEVQAAEMMRRLKYHEARLFQVRAPFAAEASRLRERLAEVSRPIEARIAWYRQGLEGFHRASLAAKRVKPKVNLPHGSILLKNKPPTIEVTDEAELLAWAKGEGIDLLPDPPKEKVMKGKLNKALTIGAYEGLEPGTEVPFSGPGGQKVPGVRVVAADRDFSVVKEGKSSG